MTTQVACSRAVEGPLAMLVALPVMISWHAMKGSAHRSLPIQAGEGTTATTTATAMV